MEIGEKLMIKKEKKIAGAKLESCWQHASSNDGGFIKLI